MRPTLLLARAFFRRLFESELMQQGIPQVQLVIWGVALVVAPGLLLSLRSALTYARLRLNGDREALMQAMLIDRLLLITISMAVLGIVGLVIWDGVFPDRRDARHLGILPLPGRVMILARLLALCALGGLFLIGVNAIPMVTFGALAGEYGAAASTFRGVLAQGLAMIAAGAWAFFTLIAIQGALLNVMGRRAAEQLSLVLQVILVAGLLQLVLLLPQLREVVSTHGAASAAIRQWIPSFWFLALYDVLAGRPSGFAGGGADVVAVAFAGAGGSSGGSSGTASRAIVAVIATLTATAAALGLFAASHRRLMRVALESREASLTRGRIVKRIIAGIAEAIDRGPLTRAVSALTMLTIVRSRPHRMLLSNYIGVACAIIIAEIGPSIARDGWIAVQQPSVVMLAAPLMMQFCAVIGTRLLLAIPAEPKANWVVRLYEPDDRRVAIDSVRNVLLAMIVLPIACAATVIAMMLWGAWVAIVHTIMCVEMGWLLVETVLIGFRKIPFTCTYFPGRSRVRTLWPFYLVALMGYSLGIAAAERALLPYPHVIAIVIIVLTIAIASLTWVRARVLAEPFGLRFEEEDPDALFPGFRFSEQLASVERPSRPDVQLPQT